MKTVCIVGGGPIEQIPDLSEFGKEEIIWIGADKGAITLLQKGIVPHLAVGDFDSLQDGEFHLIKENVKEIATFPVEKDATDIELAIEKAIELKANVIYLFGVTGGRLDHELITIQLLYKLAQQGIKGIILNEKNWIELKLPSKHTIEYDPNFKYISFIPQSEIVTDLTLEGFYYPLHNETIELGSSITVSNYLIGKKGTFSFKEGILLVIKSHDGR